MALAPAVAPANPAPQPTAPPPVTPGVLAATQLRSEAQTECARHQWGICIDRLDDAAKLDPEGDRLPEYALLREIAKEKLGGSTPTDPNDFGGGEAKPRFGPGGAPRGRTP